MAGLIPQHFIDDLLERSDIVDIIGSRLALKKTGRNYSGLCPFHQEKTPSFSVSPDKQFYYCFGCGAGGNSIQFLMDYERNDFPQTVENLARHIGLEVPREQSSDPLAAQKRQQQRSEQDALYELMENIGRFYQKQLSMPSGARAQQYIQQRQLNQDSIERFEIGYAPERWDALIKEFGHTEQDMQALFKAGMLVQNDNGKIYDRFRHRLMFPIRDKRGRIVGFGGRTLGDDKAKYINSPETVLFSKSKELYGLYHAKKHSGNPTYMLICEGYMDVIALHQHGIQQAVATLGTATNELHLKTLFRYCPNLVFCFDGDAAGQRAAQRGMQILLSTLEDGYEAKFLFLPKGEDPDSFVNQHGMQHFNAAIKQATHLSDYFFNILLNDNAGKLSIAEQARLGKQALPLIEKIPGKAYKQLLLQELQKRTHLDEFTLQDIAYDNKKSSNKHANTPPESTPTERPTQYNKRHQLHLTSEKRALSLLLNTPTLANTLDISHLPQHNAEQALLLEIIQHVQSLAHVSSNRLLGFCLNHSHKQLLLDLLAQGNEKDLSEEQSKKELDDCITHLKSTQETLDKQRTINQLAEIPPGSINNLDPEIKERYLKLFKKK